MANVSILNLPVAVSVSGAEYVPLVQGGTTKRATASLIGAGPTASTQSANTIYAGPTSGGATTPTFRALVAADVPASILTLGVGSSAVSGGTTTRVLYDNAGVLGEYSISGTGSVAMTTSPTFVTPTLGAATATTINKLTLTAPALGSTLTIADGKTLTSSVSMTLQGGDAAVLSIAAGKTLTASNTLTLAGTDATTMTFPTTSTTVAGLSIPNVFTSAIQTVQSTTGTSPGWYAQITGDSVPRVRVGLNATDVASIAFGSGAGARDLFLERAGAAQLRYGAPDAASPVAQIISMQNVVAGTTDTAGVDMTIKASQGTGTGVGGKIIFQAAKAAAGTGSTQNALATVFTLDSVASYGLFPAGTALAAPLKLTSGTNLTTAAAGAIEYDGTCFYDTAVASSRQVRNSEQVQVLSSPRTVANDTAAHAIFNATTNGAITLAATTSYEFEMVLQGSGFSSSSHSFSITFALSGTVTSLHYVAIASQTAAQGSATITNGTAATVTQITAAGTATSLNAYIRGVIRANGAGTVTPQLTQNTASAAGTIDTDSFFRCWPIGTNTVTNVGNWS